MVRRVDAASPASLAAVVGACGLALGCGETRPILERAVVAAEGSVADLHLMAQAEGGYAVSWLERIAPGVDEGHAAFLRLTRERRPTGPVYRDANLTLSTTGPIERDGEIWHVLAQQGDGGQVGFVLTRRESVTGELRADPQTLPLFLSGTAVAVRMVHGAQGSVLIWAERQALGAAALDVLQWIPLDDDGMPVGLPLLLADAPREVSALEARALADGRIAVAAQGSNSVTLHLLSDGADSRLAFRSGAADSGVLGLELLEPAFWVLFSTGGVPQVVGIEEDGENERPVEPTRDLAVTSTRLVRSGSRLLVVGDDDTGASYVWRIAPTLGPKDGFPLSGTRCREFSSLPTDPLTYACAAQCFTKDCGTEWIYVGLAEL